LIVQALEDHFAEKQSKNVPAQKAAKSGTGYQHNDVMRQQSTPVSVLGLIAIQKGPKPKDPNQSNLRASRGAQRNCFNENLARVPGLYNEHAKVTVDVNPVESYDFLNLTA